MNIIFHFKYNTRKRLKKSDLMTTTIFWYATLFISGLVEPVLCDNQQNHAINFSCPRFVFADTSNQGFGSRLEHYIYFMGIANLLRLPLSFDGIVGPVNHSAGYSDNKHSGYYEYEMLSTFFELNTTYNSNYLQGTLKLLDLKYTEEINFHTIMEVSKGKIPLANVAPCGRLIKSNIKWCNVDPKPHPYWCLHSKKYDFFDQARPLLNAVNNFNEKCRPYVRNGIWRNQSIARVSVHIRNGDICLKCQNIDYFQKFLSAFVTWAGLRGAHDMDVLFVSQFPLKDEFTSKFPGASFLHTKDIITASCALLTSDAILATGSSFPTAIAIFGQDTTPVIFEERSKNHQKYLRYGHSNKEVRYHNFGTNKNAILLDNGEAQISDDEIKDRVAAALLLHWSY